MRLRRLRHTVLRARAIARVLDSQSGRVNSVFARSAQHCWRISRVITGKLRAHPYLAYQQGPGDLRTISHHVAARLLGGLAHRRGRECRTFAAELQRVSRELDDVRALTWSSELSDTLGRSQTHLRSLVAELHAAAGKEAESANGRLAPKTSVVAGARHDSGSVAGQRAYLAISGTPDAPTGKCPVLQEALSCLNSPT